MIESSYENPVFKLIDFGLSMKRPYQENLSRKCQVEYYRAPEIFIGAEYDERVDLWSLGVTFAELILGGDSPFGDYNDSQSIKMDRQIVSF